MATLEQIITANPNKCLDVTDGIGVFKINCVIDSGAVIMDDATEHNQNEDKWGIYVPNYDLDAEKEKAKTLIDENAGKTRVKYVTNIPGQSATYLRKEKHAQSFRDDGYPEASINLPKYRYIKGEVDANGGAITGQQAADTILATADQWDALNQLIESERLKGKIAVKNSVSYDQIITARDSAIAVLQSI